MEEIPSFSSASPVSTPVSPSSSHFFLHHNKASEELGGGGQSPSSAYNINNNNSRVSAAHHPRISLTSIASPVLKSRGVASSRSFNRATANKSSVHSNGSTVTRAASFQSRLHLNGYSIVSGPGSDNDSLHSSTSSLEYSGGGGGALPLTKLGSYLSPPSQGEYHRAQPPPPHREGGANVRHHPNMKKFSSHGSVFHSAMDQGPGMQLGLPEQQGVNHGSMPSLDLQSCDRGGGLVGMRGGGGSMSPGLRYANTNANWSGRPHHASSFGGEGYCGPKNYYQLSGTQVHKAPQHKAKEISRLNKFPLDLNSLVSSPSTTSPTKTPSPNPPQPAPRSTAGLQHRTSSSSTSASPSASLSSLDGGSDTPPPSLHHPFLPFTAHSVTLSQGSTPAPEMMGSTEPLSPARSPKQKILPQPLPNRPNPPSPSRPRAMWSVEDGPGDAGDSVGSILQRIASFSQHAAPGTSPPAVGPPPTVQSSGGLSSETTLMPPWKEGKKKLKGEC